MYQWGLDYMITILISGIFLTVDAIKMNLLCQFNKTIVETKLNSSIYF